MPWTMNDCAKAVAETGLRYHHDQAEEVIRLVFVTSRYLNLRGEHLAVVNLSLPAGGERLRASIERAIAVGPDPAAACLDACRFAASMPLVGVEYDEDFDNLRLVVESPLADSRLTPPQLRSMIDRLVDAAEIWQAVHERQHAAGEGLVEPTEPTEKAA